LANSFSYEIIKTFYPRTILLENSRINVSENQHAYDLFSPRNLQALSILFSEIEKIQNEKIKDILKFCFTSCLGQASKMVFVLRKKIDKKNSKKKERTNISVGSWVIGYWKPVEHFEINVWNCFENKFRKTLKAKQQQQELFIKPNKLISAEKLFKEKSGCTLLNEDAQNTLRKFPSNSVDYIITDPPHGNRIPYLELSQLWNGWLKKTADFEGEIVISSAKGRNKFPQKYNDQLNLVFKEIYRILKPTKKFTLLFNSLDDDTWINIIVTLNKIGFNLLSIDTLNYSANSVVQDNRQNGLKTDFILTYIKSVDKPKEIKLLNGSKGTMKIEKCIKLSKSQKDNIETYEILNNLFFKFLKNNQFFRLSEAIKLLYSSTEKLSSRNNTEN
jgi:hypothetical protein